MIHIRPTTTADIEACGQIIFDAFQDFADRYNLPTEFPTLAFSIDIAEFGIQDPQIYSIVAIEDGQIIGVNFLDACNPIYSVGPIAVAPDCQKRGIGRMLMGAVLERGKGAIGIRLTQDTVNAATLALYPAVGFDIQELLILVTGKPKSPPIAEIEVRDLTLDDLAACGELCQQIYGF
ncbi:MAG: GNAT family N-acetyltransferase, partial [Leptolyngbyaceae cyanobacterium SM1_3_5]|nr:GNAT family N-acetyltransferase [Leptolyngbyaceae cyanobacterium SM1_3_5]